MTGKDTTDDSTTKALNDTIRKRAELLTNFSANLNKITGKLAHIENIWDVKKLADTLDEVNTVMERAKLAGLVKDLAKKLENVKKPEVTTVKEPNENTDHALQQGYRKKVLETVRSEYPKTQEDYALQLILKKEWIHVQAKALSNKIKQVLPTFLKECTPDLVFRLEDIRECPMDETPCDRFQVFSGFDEKGELVMNYGISLDKADLPVKNIRTPVIKAIYERTMDFIKKSNLPMYNPKKKEGFWKGFMVRTNYAGNSLLLIEASVLDESTGAEEKITKVVSELKEHFECSDAKNLNIVSLLLRVVQNKKSEVKVVFGDELIEEIVDDLKLKIFGKNFYWSNPFGVRNLSKTILELADVNKEWAVLQMGCGCGIASLYLARECKELVLTDMSNLLTERMVANGKDNDIDNITLVAGHATKELENIMEKLKAYENVCVFMYALFNFKENQDVILIRKNENVKKVLIVSRFTELGQARKLVALCQKKAEWKEPFVITRVVSVDMSPYDDDVKMIFLLVRESLVSEEIKANENYSEAKVTEFMDITKKKLNTVRTKQRKRGKGNKVQDTPPARRDAKRPPRPLLEVPLRFQTRSNPNPRHNRYSGSFSNAPYSAQSRASGYNAASQVQNSVETALAVALAVRQLGEVFPGLTTNLADLVNHNVRPNQPVYEERVLPGRDHYGPRRAQEVRGRAPVTDREFEDRSPDHKFTRQGFNERVPSRQMPRRQSVQDAGYSSWGANDNYEDFDGAGAADMIPNRDGYGSRKRGFDSRESNPYTQRNTAANYSQDDDINIRRAPVQDSRIRGQGQTGRGSRSLLNSEIGMGTGSRGYDSQYAMDDFEAQDDHWGAGQRAVASNMPLRDQVQNYQSANWDNNNYY